MKTNQKNKKQLIRYIVASTRKNYRFLDKNINLFSNPMVTERLQKASKHLKAATALILDGLYDE